MPDNSTPNFTQEHVLFIVVFLLFFISAILLLMNIIKSIKKAGFFSQKEIKTPLIITSKKANHKRKSIASRLSHKESRNVDQHWIVLRHSAKGKDHVMNNTECQDSSATLDMDSWGVAVVCDGAGSQSHSHLGSRFVASNTAKLLKFAVEQESWVSTNTLPNLENWTMICHAIFQKVLNDLIDYFMKEKISPDKLGCTVIALVYSPIGVLVTNIGDGRAAVMNQDKVWEPIITPTKGGSYNNETVFINTKLIWTDPKKWIPCNIYRGEFLAFTLLTDGCENFSYITHQNISIDKNKPCVVDQNKPFPGFYDSVINTVFDKIKANLSHEKEYIDDLNIYWINIIEKGSAAIASESDDKTMILGLNMNLIDNNHRP